MSGQAELLLVTDAHRPLGLVLGGGEGGQQQAGQDRDDRDDDEQLDQGESSQRRGVGGWALSCSGRGHGIARHRTHGPRGGRASFGGGYGSHGRILAVVRAGRQFFIEAPIKGTRQDLPAGDRLLAIYCHWVQATAMKLCTMNVSLTPKLVRHVQSQLGGQFGNASEYVRELLRRDMLAQQNASLAPLSERDQAEIATQIDDDPVLAQMARHSVAVSRKARP